MESMLNFVSKFTGVVKNHIAETSDCLGKEVVDSTAKKSGICVDKIKVAYGAKFSMLGHNYNNSVMKQLESFDEDVLVCQGKGGLFFIPMSEVGALGNSLILVNAKIGQPENGSMDWRREEVFRKFSRTRGEIKRFLPNVEESATRKKKKGRLNIFY
jgi:sporulation protein YlmC with PRC-barrel domain